VLKVLKGGNTKGNQVEIITQENGLTIETNGIASILGYELSASVVDAELSEECLKFIRSISEYIQVGKTICDGETIKYGYWLTKVVLKDNKFNFWEYEPEATKFVPGINNTLFYWKAQHQICNKVGAFFSPPIPDQMITISDGVYEGDDVEGVRYPSPDHMSGWWLTTDRYDGNIKSLKVVHAHHVTAKRPDLARFLALPYGYRFFSPSSDVWRDTKIIEEMKQKEQK
jgi:hypothetical protein